MQASLRCAASAANELSYCADIGSINEKRFACALAVAADDAIDRHHGRDGNP
jgi:hypothetical protein